MRPHEDEAARYRWRAARAHRLRPVRRRGQADDRGEARAERAEAGEPDEQADLGHGEVGGAQQVLGALDPAVGQVPAGRLAVGLRERAQEVVPGAAGPPCEPVEVEGLGVGAVDQVPGGAQVGEQVDGYGHDRSARWLARTRGDGGAESPGTSAPRAGAGPMLTVPPESRAVRRTMSRPRPVEPVPLWPRWTAVAGMPGP